MLDLAEINREIEKLENCKTCYATCERLSILYNVRDHMTEQAQGYAEHKHMEHEGDTQHEHMKHGEEKAVMKSDAGEIMPCYKTYCDTKKKYRRYEVTEQPLEMATNDLCCDMKKFILSLMSNADTTEEKNKVKEMIVQLHEMFQKGV